MKPLELLRHAGIHTSERPSRLSGGDMGEVWKVGRWVVKTLDNPPSGLFAAEARGLGRLEASGVRVPSVHWVSESGIVMPYLESGPPDWRRLGEMLARLHRGRGDWYGGDEPMFIGPFELPKVWGSNWKPFWINQRIAPMLEATSETLGSLRGELEALLEGVPLAEEGPCLLHGDLWSGNVYHGDVGPYLIDPSCWMGERAVDVAMMRLFGGFPTEFWDAYGASFPMPPEVEAVLPVYQLYFLLVHVRAFGRGYLHGVRGVAQSLRAL
jgi:phosphatidylserine decarboxylase